MISAARKTYQTESNEENSTNEVRIVYILFYEKVTFEGT